MEEIWISLLGLFLAAPLFQWAFFPSKKSQVSPQRSIRSAIALEAELSKAEMTRTANRYRRMRGIV